MQTLTTTLPAEPVDVPVVEIPAAAQIACELHRDDPKYQMAIVLYLQMHAMGHLNFPVSNCISGRLGISSRTKRNGLKILHDAGLISVLHRRGRAPWVVIEKPIWFNDLPHFVGAVALSRMTKHAIRERACSGTTVPVALRVMIHTFTASRSTNPRLTMLPSNGHIWRAFADLLEARVGEESIFNLGPDDIRTAFVAFRERSECRKDNAIALYEMSEFNHWVHGNGCLSDIQFEQIRQEVFVLLQPELAAIPKNAIAGQHLIYRPV